MVIAMTGKGFREWRRRMGWTQLKAARELGIGISTLKRLEAKESYIPRVYELAAYFIEQNGEVVDRNKLPNGNVFNVVSNLPIP